MNQNSQFERWSRAPSSRRCVGKRFSNFFHGSGASMQSLSDKTRERASAWLRGEGTNCKQREIFCLLFKCLEPPKVAGRGCKLCHPTRTGMRRWLHSLLNDAHPSRGDARTKNLKTANDLSRNEDHQQP